MASNDHDESFSFQAIDAATAAHSQFIGNDSSLIRFMFAALCP